MGCVLGSLLNHDLHFYRIGFPVIAELFNINYSTESTLKINNCLCYSGFNSAF